MLVIRCQKGNCTASQDLCRLASGTHKNGFGRDVESNVVVRIVCYTKTVVKKEGVVVEWAVAEHQLLSSLHISCGKECDGTVGLLPNVTVWLKAVVAHVDDR